MGFSVYLLDVEGFRIRRGLMIDRSCLSVCLKLPTSAMDDMYKGKGREAGHD